MRLTVCVITSLLALAWALPATAQRRPIGAEKLEKVDLPDGDEPTGDQAKEDEEAAKKREAEAKAKAEAEKQKILDEEKKREAAEAAARKAAEEAKRKKAEAAAAKKAAAEKKKQDDADKRLRAELKAARSERVLVRKFNNLRLRISLTPGAPELKAVEEVRVDIAEKLKVPDPRYGEHKPIKGANLTATVRFVEAVDEPPTKGKKKRKKRAPVAAPEPLVYRVHPLGDAGLYGFHTTMLMPGKYEVAIAGNTAAGERIEGRFDLYPGQWPPPDWDVERSRAAESTSRRTPITF